MSISRHIIFSGRRNKMLGQFTTCGMGAKGVRNTDCINRIKVLGAMLLSQASVLYSMPVVNVTSSGHYCSSSNAGSECKPLWGPGHASSHPRTVSRCLNGAFSLTCLNVLFPISKSDQKLKANKKEPDKITF